MCIQVTQIPVLLEAMLSALGVVGGFMSVVSGFRAALFVYWKGRSGAEVADQVIFGLAQGFVLSSLLSVVTFIIVLSG